MIGYAGWYMARHWSYRVWLLNVIAGHIISIACQRRAAGPAAGGNVYRCGKKAFVRLSLA